MRIDNNRDNNIEMVKIKSIDVGRKAEKTKGVIFTD